MVKVALELSSAEVKLLAEAVQYYIAEVEWIGLESKANELRKLLSKLQQGE